MYLHISFIMQQVYKKDVVFVWRCLLVNAEILSFNFHSLSSAMYTCVEASRLTEIQQNGLPSEEEGVGDVPTPQTTPMAPPTSSGGPAQTELPSPHLQGETDGPNTESEAYSMETQEPETAGKGMKLCGQALN